VEEDQKRKKTDKKGKEKPRSDFFCVSILAREERMGKEEGY